ncbi:hypothetical protein A0H76_2901 [Hepatospora eriocheir]|uniref:Uncharacterized protein n=1 Tax=Hepatospora eriocheir TaxID=1081669 RepID=A0A1X0Q5L4_9MICR|nr:hypothetical protein A0H76_2901 [Hepatospora eriocheir]
MKLILINMLLLSQVLSTNLSYGGLSKDDVIILRNLIFKTKSNSYNLEDESDEYTCDSMSINKLKKTLKVIDKLLSNRDCLTDHKRRKVLLVIKEELTNRIEEFEKVITVESLVSESNINMDQMINVGLDEYDKLKRYENRLVDYVKYPSKIYDKITFDLIPESRFLNVLPFYKYNLYKLQNIYTRFNEIFNVKNIVYVTTNRIPLKVIRLSCFIEKKINNTESNDLYEIDLNVFTEDLNNLNFERKNLNELVINNDCVYNGFILRDDYYEYHNLFRFYLNIGVFYETYDRIDE